ncbi:MAG: hypothetical protein WAQ98_05095 [Blastocatellia bacterium]
MTNSVSIKEKILNIEQKIYLRLARKYYRSIRCEIKVDGIDEGISIYRKEVYRLNINKVLVAGLISLLVAFNALMKPTVIASAYYILSYIKPEYQMIVVGIAIYNIYKQEIYIFAYYEMLKEAMKEYKVQKAMLETHNN